MQTPKTDSILSGLLQLPTIATSTAEGLASKVRKAELAMIEAQEAFDRARRALADELTEEGDGWTFQEIWMTNLRGDSVIMSHLREKGLDD